MFLKDTWFNIIVTKKTRKSQIVTRKIPNIVAYFTSKKKMVSLLFQNNEILLNDIGIGILIKWSTGSNQLLNKTKLLLLIHKVRWHSAQLPVSNIYNWQWNISNLLVYSRFNNFYKVVFNIFFPIETKSHQKHLK